MKLICGLGNPGSEYENTRHNIGFQIVDTLAGNLKIDGFEKKHKGLINYGSIRGRKIALLKPMTYMNLSGESVRLALIKEKLDLEDILIVHDDVDIELSYIQFRKDSGSGGHNGIASIIDEIKSNSFSRLRIGIGRSNESKPMIDHVLGLFADSETEKVKKVIEKASEAIISWVMQGHVHAMNAYNRKKIE